MCREHGPCAVAGNTRPELSPVPARSWASEKSMEAANPGECDPPPQPSPWGGQESSVLTHVGALLSPIRRMENFSKLQENRYPGQACGSHHCPGWHALGPVGTCSKAWAQSWQVGGWLASAQSPAGLGASRGFNSAPPQPRRHSPTCTQPKHLPRLCLQPSGP